MDSMIKKHTQMWTNVKHEKAKARIRGDYSAGLYCVLADKFLRKLIPRRKQ